MRYVLVSMRGPRTPEPEAKHTESKYDRDCDKVEKVLESPPATWHPYKGSKDGFFSIIEMELAELHRAHAANEYHGVIENLVHLAAACLHAHHEMTCAHHD